MTDNPQEPTAQPSAAAKKVLSDGDLLRITEELALKQSNNYDFARRIVQEFSLIIAGQAIESLDLGQLDRAYSHVGIYAPPGLGKDYTWKLIRTSGIFPHDCFRMKKIENVTEAVLIGTITENTVIPPITITEDIIFVGEFSTLIRGLKAESIAADMRAMLESGEYTRRLAKIGQLKELLRMESYSRKARYIKEQLEECEKLGMTIDLDKSQIHIKTTTSWIIASARFGSNTRYGRSLLTMGDLNRYRWRSYLPDREERLKVTSEAGSLPPIKVDVVEKRVCSEAWAILIPNLKKWASKGLKIPRDEQSFYERKRVWDETLKVLVDSYGDLSDLYFNQLVSLRSRAEFTRLMYQHAALKQFARNHGVDFSMPSKFIIDYEEDGEFAKQLWISEYVPSMIDVINDVTQHHSRGRSARGALTIRGIAIVIERLKKGHAKRSQMLKEVAKAGVSSYILDNSILPLLLKQGRIVREKHGWYSLADSEQ